MNYYRHGLRSARDPVGCSFITRQGTEFRKALETRLLADGREIGIYEAGVIAAAVAHLKHAAKERRWLRVNFDDLSYDQRLAFSREEPKSLDALAKCLKELGLDRSDQQSMWDTLDAPAIPQTAATAPPEPEHGNHTPKPKQPQNRLSGHLTPHRPMSRLTFAVR